MVQKHKFAYLIREYGVPYSYRVVIDGGYVNGDAIKLELEPVISKGIVLNFGREDIKYATNGTYTTEDLRIFDNNEIPKGSLIDWKGNQYKVAEKDPNMEYSDFNVWLCKKVNK